MLLWADAMAAGLVSGSAVDGNLVAFAGGQGAFYVAPGCSSLHNISLAVLLWASLTQLLGLDPSHRLVASCLGAMAAVVAVNILRLAAMARFPAHFQWLHEGGGEAMFAWASLVAALAVILWGIHAETRARA